MEMAKEQELILVLDFGSQYNQLITRRIREMGVYSELHDHEISIEEIKKMNQKVLSYQVVQIQFMKKVHLQLIRNI